jgi:hypothetical protein
VLDEAQVVVLELVVTDVVTIVRCDVAAEQGGSGRERRAGDSTGVLWIGLEASAAVQRCWWLCLKMGKRW